MEKNLRAHAYVNYISILFFLVYGVMMLDASGITYYSDVLMQELGITASQYSTLNAAVWCTKAVSSIVVGILADRTGLRKWLLVPLLIAAGAFSICTSFANSYVAILVLRFMWGMCVGSTLSMLVSIVGKNLVKNDYGFRSGFISCGSAVIANTLGPILLTHIVLQFSWRAAFLLTGFLLFVMGLTIQFSVKEVQCEKLAATENALKVFWSSLRELCRNRSFMLCLWIGIFECAAKLAITIFAPLYLTDIMGIDTELKGTLLSAMGLIYIPVTFVIPALADRFSGKSVMLVTFVICLLTPLTMTALEGSVLSVVALVLFGHWAASTVSIFIYMIPGQALPERLIGTANGLIMGISVFFGGCIAPLVLGKIAELDCGIHTIMVVCCAMFIVCILLTALLKNKKAASTEAIDG